MAEKYVIKRPTPPRVLNDGEIATILHALRGLQECYASGGRFLCGDGLACDHFEDIEPLTFDEIDSLCEEINRDSVSVGYARVQPELSPTENVKFASLLKSRFPWLDSDDHADAADAVDGVAGLYEELTDEVVLDPLSDKFRAAAHQKWDPEDETDVEVDGVVSISDGGAYVQGWLWVSNEEAGIKPEQQ